METLRIGESALGVFCSMWLMSLLSDDAVGTSKRKRIQIGRLGGIALIGLATAIWGYGNVVTLEAESVVPPLLLLLLRFLIASALLMPFVWRSQLGARDWLFGLGVGAILGLGVYSQGVAMLSVPVDQVAFIGALYVVLVPLTMALLARRWPHPLVWITVIMSLVGVVLLIGHLSMGLQVGTLWAFAGAVGFTLQIIGTTAMTNKMGALALAGMQSLGAAIVLLIPLVIQQAWGHPSAIHEALGWSKTVWWQIGYIAVFAQAVAIWLQAWGQSKVTETEAALAFNTEPVWTALFALLVLSQSLTTVQFVGATLIVGSLTFITWISGKT